jgi:hypothetical protein
VSQRTPEFACEHLPNCAAYVLRALEEPEADAHREHLAGCPTCEVEVHQLQGVVDALAVAVPPVSVPGGLRTRVMASVEEEAEQLHAASGDDTRAAAVWRPRRGSRPRWGRRLLPAVAVVAALGAGLVVGAVALNTGSSEQTEVIRAVVVGSGHRATAELRKVGSQVELVVVGLPAPPPGRIYEVWLEHGAAAPEPTDALFSVTKGGNGAVGVPGDLRGVSKVLVTDEPLGGSLKPTRAPVIVGSI